MSHYSWWNIAASSVDKRTANAYELGGWDVRAGSAQRRASAATVL
jgi:hypothetical protein